MSTSATNAALQAALAWSEDAEAHIQLLNKRVEELRTLLDDAHRQRVQLEARIQSAKVAEKIQQFTSEAMQDGSAPQQTAAQEAMAQARKRIWEHTAAQENPNPDPRTTQTIARHITGRIWQDQDMRHLALSPDHAAKIAAILEDYLKSA